MANYAESLLAQGERVVRRAHQHWFVFIASARYAVLALVLALLASVLGLVTSLSGTAWQVLSFVILGLFVFGVLSFGWSILRFRNEEYLITNRRLIHAEGVINKKTMDSSLEKINDATLTESIVGRIFGFGDLDVLTASEEGIDRLRMLRDAKDFKRAMIEAKHELEVDISRPTMPPLRTPAAEPVPSAASGPLDASPVLSSAAPPPAAAPPPVDAQPPAAAVPPAPVAERTVLERTDDLATALDRLGQLRDKGLITPEEFDAKKRELLDRL